MRAKFDSLIIMICIISTIARFALDSYLPSLPGIAKALNLSSEQIQITLTLYLTGFSLSQIIYGPLSDHYGRKIILITGLIIFLASNTLSIFADSAVVLAATRLFAGVGAGCCAVLNRAIASDRYQGAEFAKAWSYTTTTLTFTLMLAPLIGGAIQDLYNWKANILFATFYVSCIFLILVKFLPETNFYAHRKPLNAKKVAKTYWSMINNKRFMGYILCYTLTFASLIAYFQVSPFIFINNLGYSATTYGLLSIYIAVSYFLSGLLVQHFVKKLGINRLLIIGMLIMLLGSVLMLLGYLVSDLNGFIILFPTIIFVIGSRIVIPNAVAGSLQQFHKKAGCASALIGSFQILGSAIVSFILAQFYHDSQLPLALTLIILTLSSLACLMYTIKQQAHFDHMQALRT